MTNLLNTASAAVSAAIKTAPQGRINQTAYPEISKEEGGFPIFTINVTHLPAGETTDRDDRYLVTESWPEAWSASVSQETKEGKKVVWRAALETGEWEYSSHNEPLPYEEVLENLCKTEAEFSSEELAEKIADSVHYSGGYVYPGDFWQLVGQEGKVYWQQINHWAQEYYLDSDERKVERIKANLKILNGLPEGSEITEHRVMSSDVDHNGLEAVYRKYGDVWYMSY